MSLAVFADTSGLYALLDAADASHAAAANAWRQLMASEHELESHQFVLLEVWSLIQARLGFAALDVFQADYLPLLQMHEVTGNLLAGAIKRCTLTRRRSLSLTDCVSLEFVGERQIRAALAFDRHFQEAGVLLPSRSSWLNKA